MSSIEPVPPTGLGSNSNYILSSGIDDKPITGLSVTVDVTEDIVANIGFSVQLNAYSPTNATCAWQQYFFSFQTTNGFPGTSVPAQLFGFVNNWDQSLRNTLIYWVSSGWPAFPGSTIPAGTRLTIALTTDANGVVTGATFVVVDQLGVTVVNQGVDLLSDSAHAATAADLAPIVAFELDVVGPINATQSLLWSGAGVITYTAAEPLYALSQEPQNAQDPLGQDDFTLETANTAYSQLTANPAQTIAQGFSVKPLPPYVPGSSLVASQQFGADQTDVFAIDRAGQLVVFYAAGAGRWNSTIGFGPTGLARRNAALAVAQHQGVPDQTDVFLVAQNGQLNVFSVSASGTVSGPVPFGPAGLAPSGAPLAASPQFGVPGQTVVFVVDGNGQLNVLWADGTGTWAGPETIGPAQVVPAGANLAVSQQIGIPDQTDVFLIDANGQLRVYWVDGAGTWRGPEAIGPQGVAPPGSSVAVSQQFGARNQTDVFVFDSTGRLNVYWVDGARSWNGPVKVGSEGVAPPGAPLAACQQFGAVDQTDVFVVDATGRLNAFWVDGAKAWYGPTAIGPEGVAAAGSALAASRQFGLPAQTDVFLVGQSGTNGPGWPTVYWVDGAGSWSGPKTLTTEA
jgi:hypothetical protein